MKMHDITALFSVEGQELFGSAHATDVLLDEAHASFPSKPCCLVREWTLVDLDVTDDELNVLIKHGCHPTVLLALNVVSDEAGIFPPGGLVKSSFQVSFQRDWFFETGNTLYVLTGQWHRGSASVDAMSSLT